MSGDGFATRAIHDGFAPDPATGAVNPPIYATSTFAQDGVASTRGGFEYTRTGNPTRGVLETNLASLESGSYARAFASGMAATDTALRALTRPGDHIVVPDDAYGGTFRLVDRVITSWGVSYSTAPVDDHEAIAAAITDRTAVIWVETPTNPLLTIADIPGIARIAHETGARVVVDNTFASPYLQQPLSLGADIVLHSTTKYIGGHSDVLGGALITNDGQLDAEFAFLQNSAGAVPGPFDAYLTLRGIKTLAVRMDKHCDNAERLVDFLVGHPAVSSVLYPGMAGHAGHTRAAQQMYRFGGMISIRLAAGHQAALDMCDKTGVFTLAESLGGVESLIEHPAAMTHASAAGSALEVPDDLVRLSVGIEDSDDLIRDLETALA